MDYVIPMVFDEDPWWQSDYMRLGRVYHRTAYYSINFRSWGIEHYLIKAVKKYMPFVETIHIILSRESQVQDWMLDEGVHIVLHKDFVPDEFLPTFNSRTLEMFLHRIPGLSEQFIYGNDDIIPLSPLKEEDFFRDGLPVQLYEFREYPDNPSNFQQPCQNGLNMIAGDFGLHFTDKWMVGGHSLSPFLKSVCEEVFENHKQEILRSITRERRVCNYNQYIYAFQQHFANEYCDQVPPRTFLPVSLPTSKIVKTIMKDDVGILCINDNGHTAEFAEKKEAICNALKRKIENY